ncbi:hypothetical protein BB558_007492 [Smittium angustum]|uniref:Tyrosine specific protein phosphatases domain-containing protein n=1 Tax=Smittium angustum TaxID=133377 RepID=A0A2U1IUV7_SMIAN|nr:hypothetical protein BB558_007492 [Smittium angustum]
MVPRSSEFYIPPYRFGRVEIGLYRGGYPKKRNSSFLERLKLKTIISLIPKEANEVLKSFCSKNNIEHVFIPVEFPEENVTLYNEGISKCLAIMTDVSKQPVYYHCLDGSNVTGLLTMCLRKLQLWQIPSIELEFLRFEKNEEIISEESEFVRGYDGNGLTLQNPYTSWLWPHKTKLIAKEPNKLPFAKNIHPTLNKLRVFSIKTTLVEEEDKELLKTPSTNSKSGEKQVEKGEEGLVTENIIKDNGVNGKEDLNEKDTNSGDRENFKNMTELPKSEENNVGDNGEKSEVKFERIEKEEKENKKLTFVQKSNENSKLPRTFSETSGIKGVFKPSKDKTNQIVKENRSYSEVPAILKDTPDQIQKQNLGTESTIPSVEEIKANLNAPVSRSISRKQKVHDQEKAEGKPENINKDTGGLDTAKCLELPGPAKASVPKGESMQEEDVFGGIDTGVVTEPTSSLGFYLYSHADMSNMGELGRGLRKLYTTYNTGTAGGKAEDSTRDSGGNSLWKERTANRKADSKEGNRLEYGFEDKTEQPNMEETTDSLYNQNLLLGIERHGLSPLVRALALEGLGM